MMTTLLTQSCMYGADGVVPQKLKYAVCTERPPKENLSGPMGAYQDQDRDGLADLRYGNTERPYSDNKDKYQIDKCLYFMEIVFWDGNRNHPYESTGEGVWIALGPLSKMEVNIPFPVIKSNVLYTTGKDNNDRLNTNTAGEATYYISTKY